MILGSINSNRENLCGKVTFVLERQQLFFHNPSVKIPQLSTDRCGVKFSQDFSTRKISTFHSSCGKLFDNKRPLFLSCRWTRKESKKSAKGWLFTKTPPFGIPLLNRKILYRNNMTRKCADLRSDATQKSAQRSKIGTFLLRRFSKLRCSVLTAMRPGNS